MRTRQSAFGTRVHRLGRQPAALRAHDLRRAPPAAARAARRRAHEADVQLRSRRRADGAAPSRTAASRRSTSPTTTARTSGASPSDRSLNITPTWSPDGRSIAYTSYRRGAAEHLHLEHLSGHARGADQERTARTSLPVVVARRHAHRVHVDARRQLRDLRGEPRRLERAAADEPSRRSTSRRPGRRRARRSRSRRTAPARRRSTSIGADGLGLQQITSRVVRRPADLVAGAVQRDRVRRAHRPGLRHQGARPGHRRRCGS